MYSFDNVVHSFPFFGKSEHPCDSKRAQDLQSTKKLLAVSYEILQSRSAHRGKYTVMLSKTVALVSSTEGATATTIKSIIETTCVKRILLRVLKGKLNLLCALVVSYS